MFATHHGRFALDGLGIVVLFGLGILLWILAQFLRDSRPPTQRPAGLFRTRPPRS